MIKWVNVIDVDEIIADKDDSENDDEEEEEEEEDEEEEVEGEGEDDEEDDDEEDTLSDIIYTDDSSLESNLEDLSLEDDPNVLLF